MTLYGDDGALTTEVLGDAQPDEEGVVTGNLYLRGGGDPSSAAATRARLTRILVTSGLTEITNRVLGDESKFDRLRGGPDSAYRVSEWVGPLSALSFNHGFTLADRPSFQRNPPQYAAKIFTRELKRAGVIVRRPARAGVTPADAETLGEWTSNRMAVIARHTNRPSDNYFAETLLKNLGADFGSSGTTAAGAPVARRQAARFGARPTMVDGSGLSRQNRTTPRDVVRLLDGLDESDIARSMRISLSVAGKSGTLYDRMRGTAAKGRCRAKSGTVERGNQPRRLLQQQVWRPACVCVPDERHQHLDRPPAARPHGHITREVHAVSLRTLALAIVFAFTLAAPAAAREAVVTSFDGTQLHVSFHPATAGHKAPTILQTHGWGQRRDQNPNSASSNATGNVGTGPLRKAGFNVLTWDSRGFGESGGTVQVDYKDFEGRDVQVLLDWLAKQPEARLDRRGDPRVGMHGVSTRAGSSSSPRRSTSGSTRSSRRSPGTRCSPASTRRRRSRAAGRRCCSPPGRRGGWTRTSRRRSRPARPPASCQPRIARGSSRAAPATRW